MDWETICIEEIKAETEKAFLVRIELEDDSYVDVWVPKSQIEDPEQFSAGETDIEMNVRRWVLSEKNLL
jgi:hypothetical protein